MFGMKDNVTQCKFVAHRLGVYEDQFIAGFIFFTGFVDTKKKNV